MVMSALCLGLVDCFIMSIKSCRNEKLIQHAGGVESVLLEK